MAVQVVNSDAQWRNVYVPEDRYELERRKSHPGAVSTREMIFFTIHFAHVN